MLSLEHLNTGLGSLVVFRNLLSLPFLRKLRELFFVLEKGGDPVPVYGEFISELYPEGGDFGNLLYRSVLEDENFYIKKAACRKVPEIDVCLKEELKLLQSLSDITSEILKEAISEVSEYNGYLPEYRTTAHDFIGGYMERIENLRQQGFGIYSKYHVFTIVDGAITPVKHPDSQRLSTLSSYERERGLVIGNTLNLLEGRPAGNVLLYGDAGTGKSATVKAVANEYKDRGLRLIEVKKQQLNKLPDIIGELSENPLKFIIFIDDLTFMSNDDNFSALKAILEGSVSVFGDNVVIYATSNRRHLVKESMTDRAGDDIHLSDTIQETMGLASRFGLNITFLRPDKETYLKIVKDLAAEYDLHLPDDVLYVRAEAYALRNGGRSPRTAKQFVQLEKGKA